MFSWRSLLQGRGVKVARGLGLSRIDLKYSGGPLPHEQLLHSIELYGTKVAPPVREQLAL